MQIDLVKFLEGTLGQEEGKMSPSGIRQGDGLGSGSPSHPQGRPLLFDAQIAFRSVTVPEFVPVQVTVQANFFFPGVEEMRTRPLPDGGFKERHPGGRG
ncbi:MAG: hypothetical protein KGR69_05195 [Verrucomicrobia bacterium]|nr:hypothetical protein [Verrucomicrobiota bacterium]